MNAPGRDPSLDTLLDLHGQTMFVDHEGRFWVKFEVGFDNAHPVDERSGPGRRARREYDHKHRLRTIRPYEYDDAATLLADFWAVVDAVLREKGVIR